MNNALERLAQYYGQMPDDDYDYIHKTLAYTGDIKDLAKELKNAGYDEAADYLMSDYIKNKYSEPAFNTER